MGPGHPDARRCGGHDHLRSMKKVFAVIRCRGAAWQSSRDLEDQQAWRAHAEFMDGLANEEFVVLGGPLEGTPEVLLIARAESAEEIERRLAEDPWAKMDLLRITRIAPWTLRLGALP